MAFLKHGLLLCALVPWFLSLLHAVHCDVDLDELSKEINIYRNKLNQSPLTDSSKAQCIAEKIAKEFYEQLPCRDASSGVVLRPANQSQLPQFPHYSRKCKVNMDHTVDGVILPVYMPKLVEKLILTNCIHSQVAKYLSNPNYTTVGLATHEDCLVVALGTDTEAGSYSAGYSLSSSRYWLGLLVGLIVCGVKF